MTNHTAGPWIVDGLKNNEVFGPEHKIADCYSRSFNGTAPEMHANARLIAAAPEMFELLADYASGERNHENIRQKTKDLIAKITGGPYA